MNKAVITESIECKCECCGKQHHVLIYEEEIECEVRPEWSACVEFDKFPTKRKYCHCAYKGVDFIPEASPEDMVAWNEEQARQDFFERAKKDLQLRQTAT